MSIGLLEQALFRHVRKILQPMPGDPETIQDHLYAIGCNAMMITTQLQMQEYSDYMTFPRH